MQMYELRPKDEWKALLLEAIVEYGAVKKTTARGYAAQLMSFCELASNIGHRRNPYVLLPEYPLNEAGEPVKKIGKTQIKSLLDMELEEIEDIADEHTRRFNEGRTVDVSGRVASDVVFNTYKAAEYRVAPKRLNQQVAALKHWLLINYKDSKAQLKSTRMFRQLSFDTSSPLESRLMAQALEYKDLQQMFSMSNGEDSITLGMYSLQAFRPSLIPFFRIKHLHPRSYEIQHDGQIKWTRDPPLLIVQPYDSKGRHVTGNKASIEYPSFIPSVIAQKVLVFVNNEIRAKRKINPNFDPMEQKLSPADNKSDVDYIVRKYYRKIGYEGRPYDLRNFGSQLLKRIELVYNDKDLKELMCGHKPKDMSAVYDLRGLTIEKEEDWRDKYDKAVNRYLTERIFNIQTAEDMKAAKMMAELASKLGDEAKAKEIFNMFADGNMDLDTLNRRLTTMIQNSQEKRLERLLDQKLSERFPKGLPAPEEVE